MSDPPSDPPDERLPKVRASDGERERAVAVLRDGAADGRLTFDELARRVELAYDATTAGELERLMADLPAARSESPPPAQQRKRRRWNVAVMGGCERRGRWRPAPRTIAVAVMGGVGLDLRNATIEGEQIVITAVAVMGGIEVIVPEGVEVELSGFAIMGGREHRQGDAPVRPGMPVVHVRAYALMGGVEVKEGKQSKHVSPGDAIADLDDGRAAR